MDELEYFLKNERRGPGWVAHLVRESPQYAQTPVWSLVSHIHEPTNEP